MHIGFSIPFQNLDDARSDSDVYHHELGFALQAEMWGFDSIWTVEHHFTSYAMCPDPLQLLTYLAGQTRRIQLGTAVIVLPWHDPVRLAEQIALLDNLSGGRMLLGIGRGIAKVEYDGFRVPMDTSRQRFIEYAQAVLRGLEAGYVEHDGELLQQPRRALRPASAALLPRPHLRRRGVAGLDADHGRAGGRPPGHRAEALGDGAGGLRRLPRVLAGHQRG